MSSQLLSHPKQTQKTLDFRQKFKTQVLSFLSKKCRFWFDKGFCPFNKFCAFAHNDEEMRGKKQLNLKYKTKPCRAFFDHGFCKYGDRCQYIHKSFDSDNQSQKTRSNSEESLSSKSSNQQRSVRSAPNTLQTSSKHLNRYEMIGEQYFNLFEIIMGKESKMGQLIDAETNGNGIEDDKCEVSYQPECYSGLGACEEKKSRMYSM